MLPNESQDFLRTDVGLRSGDVIGVAVHDGEFRSRNSLLPRPYGIDRAQEAPGCRDDQHRAAKNLQVRRNVDIG